MSSQINKSFQAGDKNVKYTSKDFASLKSNLLEFAKSYFPKTYNDFSDESPGMMFIEMASYIGDVACFYSDYSFKERLIDYSSERKNLINLARFNGYKIKPTKPAVGVLDVYQLVPAIYSEESLDYIPDERYCLILQQYMELKNSRGESYITSEPVDFRQNTEISPRVATIYSRGANNVPQFFLLKKQAKIISGKILTYDVAITTAEQFKRVKLPENNVLEIISVVDSDSNRWYEVEYLAQGVIQVEDDTNFSASVQTIQNLITSKKFITSVDEENMTSLIFGPGTENFQGKVVYPSAENINVGFNGNNTRDIFMDFTKLFDGNNLGEAPANTTLTIEYITGGGLQSNSNVDEIQTIQRYTVLNDKSGFTPGQLDLFNTILTSLKVNNTVPAVGGDGEESLESIRQNAKKEFMSQGRAVTSDDYIVRVLTMPSKFGNVAKVYATANPEQNSSINLYILTYDSNKNLVPCNDIIFKNIKKYIEKYKLLTNSINIYDGYVINIGVEFKVDVYSGFNKNKVLSECVAAVKSFLSIEKMNFNEALNISQLELEVAKISGVKSLQYLTINNLNINDGAYSTIEYDINGAIKDKLLYPPKEPAIFEVKYPDRDIVGIST